MAPLASAGLGTITAHAVTLNLKTATQITTPKNDDKADKVSANQKDLYTKCVGTPPTKTQGIYLFIDCIQPPAAIRTHVILAIDTRQPVTRKATVGTITFDTPSIRTTKGGGATLSSFKVPAAVHISCNGGTTTAELSGILNLNYSSLNYSGCVMSGSMKFTGTATDPNAPDDLIIDDGSVMKINKRSATIYGAPP
ncbi:MAG: hypothetical protein ACHQ6T_16745 [Myxococcota bacterium]